MLAVVIVNYRTPAQTLACLRSLAAQADEGLAAWVVDNGASESAHEALRREAGEPGVALGWIRSPANIGFAAGCNLGIAAAMEDERTTHVLLLNSDARLVPGGLEALRERLRGAARCHLLAARMHREDAPHQVDSLGIAMYASGLASNRLDVDDPLVGPTGGLAVYSRELLVQLRDEHGEWFDEAFFCYAEDTDLAWRSLLLGYRPDYVDQVVAVHEGQASSGGGFNDFVLYHGIRNSIWVLVKGWPWRLLAPRLPLILALHAGIIARHAVRGKASVLFRLYRDAWRGMAEMRGKRKRILGVDGGRLPDLRPFVSRRFYDRAYVRRAVRELFVGHRPPSGSH